MTPQQPRQATMPLPPHLVRQSSTFGQKPRTAPPTRWRFGSGPQRVPRRVHRDLAHAHGSPSIPREPPPLGRGRPDYVGSVADAMERVDAKPAEMTSHTSGVSGALVITFPR